MINELRQTFRRLFPIIVTTLGLALVGGAVLGSVALVRDWEVFSGAAYGGGIALTVAAGVMGGLFLGIQLLELVEWRNHTGRRGVSWREYEEDFD